MPQSRAETKCSRRLFGVTGLLLLAACTSGCRDDAWLNGSACNTCLADNGRVIGKDCGEVTVAGRCMSSTTMRYCNYGRELVEVDCRNILLETSGIPALETLPTEKLRCIEIPGRGAECAVSEGMTCDTRSEGGEVCHQRVDPGAPHEGGRHCLLGGTSFYCSADAGACVWSSTASAVCRDGFDAPSCEEETFTPDCIGDVFIHGCFMGQAVATDCAATGSGVCEPESGCVMPMGAACNGVTVICSDDLPCEGADQYGGSWGTCG